MNKRLNEDSSISGQLGSARKRLQASQEKLAKLEARNIAARENVAAEQSIRKVLELKKTINGIYGTVSELGNVDSKYATALEVAAGGKIKFIVVEDDRVAARCIKFLKETSFTNITKTIESKHLSAALPIGTSLEITAISDSKSTPQLISSITMSSLGPRNESEPP